MAARWIMVRVKADTHARLKDVSKRMQAAREKGQIDYEPKDDGSPPLDAVIAELLRRDEEHAERSSRRRQESRS